MLALVASIHVLDTVLGEGKTWMVRTSPTMTGRAVFMGSGLRPSASPGKTAQTKNPGSSRFRGRCPAVNAARREEGYQPARTEPLKRSAMKALISGV